MVEFETKHIYPHISNHTLAYFQFLDDTFMIWIGLKESLLAFFKEINTIHESIKFDCKYSLKSINFLDTTQQFLKITNDLCLLNYLLSQQTDEDIYITNLTTQNRNSKIYLMVKN